jgi:hypothetical protein
VKTSRVLLEVLKEATRIDLVEERGAILEFVDDISSTAVRMRFLQLSSAVF